jgi:uncharacterized integral membrane protein
VNGELERSRGGAPARRRLSGRLIAAIAIGVLILVFVVLNRDRTKVSFIVFSTRTDLWVALLLSAVAGLIAGFLLGRRRYRR